MTRDISDFVEQNNDAVISGGVTDVPGAGMGDAVQPVFPTAEVQKPWAPHVMQTPTYTPGFSPPSYAVAAQQKQPSSFSVKHIVLTVIIALVAACIGASIATWIVLSVVQTAPQIEKNAATAVHDTLGTDTGTDLSINVAEKTLSSVVSISVVQEQATIMGMMTSEGSGSGVIIKEDGYILTNNHVIENGKTIEVTAGTQTYEATVVGTDPSSDLAILKIDATDLPAIEIGTSSDLQVGQYVRAVGNPFGLSESVSVGIISALGRTEAVRSGSSLAAYTNLIQTDAAINPGNSGGALVDADGRLIGINTLITSTSGSSAGVGFAIPIDTALDIANQLMDGGTAEHPFLGVSTQTIDSNSAQSFALPVEVGAYVVEVLADSPAAHAGLQKGDILVKIGKKDIKTSEDVFAAVRAHKAGDTIKIEYYRGDDRKTMEVKLGSDVNVSADSGSGDAQGFVPDGSSQDDPHQGFTPQELWDMLRQYGF
jgi:putative serine protease PepD